MKQNTYHPRLRRGERGLVLEVVLIVLVAMLFASLALFRSVDTATAVSGNIAFKTDASHRAQLALEKVLGWLADSGNYQTYVGKGQNAAAGNFSALMLKTDSQGIPAVLSGDLAAFDAAYTAAPIEDSGMKVRYLIERLCTRAGAASAEHCAMGSIGEKTEGSVPDTSPSLLGKPLFRVSIRVDGPRNTVAYTQVTVEP